MVYLDYSATTQPDIEVLKVFNTVSIENFANANSIHKFGVSSKKLIEQATKNICAKLNIKEKELIYTSGASESNNLAIKGICNKYGDNKRKHIITTKLEHSSVISVLNFLSFKNFEIDFVNLLEDGTVDLENLKSLVKDETLLVTICAVDSEIGIRQPIEKIGEILKNHPNCYFHSDITQCIGKDTINLENVDLASFSGHKIFCFKGIGGLYKKENIILEPLIHGGKSTSVYRSGTPQNELICSLSKAFDLSFNKLEEKKEYVLKLNAMLRENLSKYEGIYFNSNNKSISNVLNISILNIKPEDFLFKLEEYDIFVSTKSACSKTEESSVAVLALTNNKDLASSSIRISLSYKTTIEEINYFLEKFDICYNTLKGV